MRKNKKTAWPQYERYVSIRPNEKHLVMQVYYHPDKNGGDSLGTFRMNIARWLGVFGLLSDKEIETKVIEKFAEVLYDHKQKLHYEELGNRLDYIGA